MNFCKVIYNCTIDMLKKKTPGNQLEIKFFQKNIYIENKYTYTYIKWKKYFFLNHQFKIFFQKYIIFFLSHISLKINP